MDLAFTDFNGADICYSSAGSSEWDDIVSIVRAMPLFLQPSQQAEKIGSPIFDPKATNAYLTIESQRPSWHKVPVPVDLTPFGVDWDAGKNESLAEWQFSNYPFLWNNIIRSEAVYQGGAVLHGMAGTKGLIIVTRGGILPASNSTLYYEQAKKQLAAVIMYRAFSIPIRLVGLTLHSGITTIQTTWSQYPTRASRVPISTVIRQMSVTWSGSKLQLPYLD